MNTETFFSKPVRVDPEKITISQIFGNFTVRHWVATISLVSFVICSLASGAYFIGFKISEIQSLSQQTELKSSIMQLKTQLGEMQSRTESLSKENIRLLNSNKALDETLAQKNAELFEIKAKNAEASNCKFIHDEIRKLQTKIDQSSSVFFLDERLGQEKYRNPRKEALEKRLNAYQQQLSSCNSK